MSKATDFTAWTSPSGVQKRTSRSLTERTGTAIPDLPVLGIEGVAQAVADEVEAEERERHEDGREHERPRRGFHLPRALGDQHAPRRERFADAETQERQKAFRKDHAGYGQRDVN